MKTLTLAMIVKDEEETLDRCLSSVVSICNEIIIVDTGSTDKTKQIAEKHNAIIFDFTWVDDFASARNFSFRKATQDYILWLDADDVIKPQDIEKIKIYLNQDGWDALMCRYIYAHDENDQPSLVLKRHRIVKNDGQARWNDPIHEYLVFGNQKVVDADIDVHHYRTARQFERSSGRNLRILEKLYNETKGENPRHEFYYARELADSGKSNDAKLIFISYLNSKKDWEGNIINAYQRLAKIYYADNDLDAVLRTCFEAIQYNPHYIEIYNILIRVFYDQKDWQKVIRWGEMAITINKPDAMHSYQPSEYDFVPYDRLCIAYYSVGNLKKAYESNEIAIRNAPTEHDRNRCLFNRDLLVKQIKSKDGAGKKLNLGCGGKKVDGYIDVDVINTPFTDEVFSLDDIPYKDNTIDAIYSEHSLEHVTHEQAEKAIKEWNRVLKPGGELQLYVPDLDLCCQQYLQADNNRIVNGYPEKDWYKYTIFGVQKNENGVSQEYQQHKTGFSKKEITELLEKNDFIVDFCENY